MMYAFRSMLWITFCLVAVTTAAGARGQRPTPALRACQPEQPALAALFPSPAASSPSDEDDDDDDEDDDEDGEDEDGDDEESDDGDDEDVDEAIRGFLLADGVTCVGLGGSVHLSLQGDWLRAAGRKVLAWRSQDVGTFPYAAVLRFDTLQQTDTGHALGTRFSMAYRNGADPVVDRAILTFGGLTVGYDSSRFNFWDGAAFSFAARVPARQAFMLARDIALTEESSFGLSLEMPVAAVNPAIPVQADAPGARLPDVVARFLYEGETTSFQIAASAREIRRTYSGPPLIGRAALVGLTQAFTRGDVTHTFAGQAAVMLGAPAYIGSQLDGGVVRALITGNEMANGYSLIGSVTSAWTAHWTTNAYVSRYDLRLPAQAGSGRIEMNRAAANLTWSPNPAVRVGFEVGVSRTAVTLPNRVLAIDPSGTRTTALVFVERKF